MRKTVKLFALVLAMLTLFTLAACAGEGGESAKSVNVEDVKKQIIADLKIENTMDIPTNALLNFYGIQPDDVSVSACFTTEGGVFPDEIIMVTATSEDAKSRVEEKAQNRLDSFLKQAKNYSPEDYKIASECKILTCGNTVALFLSKNHVEMENIFNSNCK